MFLSDFTIITPIESLLIMYCFGFNQFDQRFLVSYWRTWCTGSCFPTEHIYLHFHLWRIYTERKRRHFQMSFSNLMYHSYWMASMIKESFRFPIGFRSVWIHTLLQSHFCHNVWPCTQRFTVIQCTHLYHVQHAPVVVSKLFLVEETPFLVLGRHRFHATLPVFALQHDRLKEHRDQKTLRLNVLIFFNS